MTLEDRVVALAQQIGADYKKRRIKSTVVNFNTPKNYMEFEVVDADIEAAGNVTATLGNREDTFDNCGDDMDSIIVSSLAGDGVIYISVFNSMPKQKLFGTFKINYQNN